jgi:hypothetical protein
MRSNKSGIVACNEKFKPYKKQRYFKLKPLDTKIITQRKIAYSYRERNVD